MRTAKKLFLSTLLLFLLTLNSFAQDLTQEQWTRLMPVLNADDSSALAANWSHFQSSGKEVALVAVLTGKSRLYKWIMTQQAPPISLDDLKDWFSLSLSGGFLEIPQMAADGGWQIPIEAWASVLTCNYGNYKEMIGLLHPELPSVLPQSRPDSVYKAMAQWLVQKQVRFDYTIIDLEVLRSPCSREIITYVMANQPPSSEFGYLANWQLYLAVQSEPADSVRKILAAGNADPNFSMAGFSLLWNSVRRNEPTITRYLLQYGADPMWMDADSSISSLAEAIKIGNPAMVKEILPFVSSVNYRHKYGNTLLHYLADYTHNDIHDVYNICSVTYDSAGVFSPGHVQILKLLKNAGADFNIRNDCDRLAIERLHQTIDTNWIDVVQVFVENVNDQYVLRKVATEIKALKNRKEEKLFRTLVNKLEQIDFLIYEYQPDQGASSSEKNNLMRQLLLYIRKLPAAHSFASPLRSYVSNKSIEMVRFIVHDVIRKYELIQPGIDTDSLRSIFVNSTGGYCKTTIIQDLLSTGIPDSLSLLIMRELLYCRPSLTLRNNCNYQTALDILINNVDLQKAYASSMLTFILRDQLLDVIKSNRTTVDPETGERLRNGLFAFRNGKAWMKKITYCAEAMLRGDGLIVDGSNIIVNVAGYGRQNTGSWPKGGCDEFDFSHIMNNTAENFAYVYLFFGEKKLTRDLYRSSDFTGAWPKRYDEASFEFQGRSGLAGIQITGRATQLIPGCTFNDSVHYELPGFILKNDDNAPISVEQGTNQFMLLPYSDTLLDRSLGDIKLDFSAKEQLIGYGTIIIGNTHYTSLPNLVVPDGNNLDNRLKLYLEIVRLKSYQAQPMLPNPERKNLFVTINVLSEWAMQRKFSERVEEDYRRVNQQISAMEEALTSLNSFYRNFATLTWENLPALIGQLERVLATSGTPPEEKERYRQFLSELRQAQSLADLARLYNELFNNKFNQLIDQAVSEYQRLTLELAQYPSPDVSPLMLDRRLLMETPIEHWKNTGFKAVKTKSSRKRK